LPKLARVGVVASSRGFVDCVGAVVGLGVIGDAEISCRAASVADSVVFTGRNVAAIVKAYVPGQAVGSATRGGVS
jgi:hypothetical protein